MPRTIGTTEHMPDPRFVMAVPFRTDYYNNYARILHGSGRLRKCLLWTRKGIPGIPQDLHELCPALGLLAYAGARCLPPFAGESFRFALHPAFDRWARTKLVPGDHVLSSYGYANSCFKYARSHGGKTFVDGGNSHPENFWNLLTEEHRTWGCSYPPISRQQYRRGMEMMEDVDYVLSPSEFVTNSFLERGFRDDQILRVFFPVDLSVFRSERAPRPPGRPFTVINTGGLSLRKGTPYLLESFRMIRKQIPDARFLLTDSITDSIKPIISRYSDLPIEWAPYLPEAELAERLRTADLFILPSLEEGLVRTALQAMACGLPVVLTPNTGANDYVEEGVNGTVVPLRDPAAIARAAEWWWEKIKGGYQVPEDRIVERLSFTRLDRVLNEHLERIGE